MNEFEVKELIANGEGVSLEFKREEEHNNDFAKTIVAFANTNGGKILVGVSDEGEIIGVTKVDEFMRRIDDVAFNKCSPPITILQEPVQIDNKQIVIIDIAKGIQRPYQFRGKFYIRSSNRVREATREEVLRLFQSSGTIVYDEIPVSQADLYDIDFDKFKQFCEEYLDLVIEEDKKEELEYYLRNFHLIKEKIPTITGVLFFGKDPQKFLSQARIVCARIDGDDLSLEPSDKKDISSAIPKMIEECERYLRLNLEEKHIIKDFNPEVVEEIPLTALREAIINAIAHRDYTINAPIRIIIFANRIEIHSPGRLPNTVTVDSMKVGGSHVPRNPTIYNLLVKMKMVTDLGSGVKRMIKLVKENTGLDVEIIESENEVVVVIPRKK